jgi:hypothetical protein
MPPTSGNGRLSSRIAVRVAYLTLLVSFLTPMIVAIIEKL